MNPKHTEKCSKCNVGPQFLPGVLFPKQVITPAMRARCPLCKKSTFVFANRQKAREAWNILNTKDKK